MPYTEEELKSYQFYLDRIENQRQKYTDYFSDPRVFSESQRNHIVVSGSNTLISFEDIDEERRKQSPFRRVGLDRDDQNVVKSNLYPTFHKGEKYDNTIDGEIDSLIPQAPDLPTAQLSNAPNDNVLNPSRIDDDGTTISPQLLSPSRTKPNERTDGYTIDLVNGDIIGLDGWEESQTEFGLDVYYLQKNRKRRFPNMKILQSHINNLLGPNIDLEIILIEKEDLDFILSAEPMEFNTE